MVVSAVLGWGLLVYRCFSVLVVGFASCFDSVLLGWVVVILLSWGCYNIALILG